MGKDLRIILWFLRPYRGRVALIFVLLFLFSLLETASIGAFYPLLNNVILKDGAAGGAGGRVLELLNALVARLPISDGILASCVFLLALVGASALFGLFAEGHAMWYRYQLHAEFLNEVYAKILGNRYLYFVERKQGDLLFIGLNASQSVGEMLMYFPKVGVELFRLLAITAFLLTISAKVTLSVFGLMLLFAAVVHLLSVRLIHPLALAIQTGDSALTALFSESVAGIRQIKIFDSRDFWRGLFREQTRVLRGALTWTAVFNLVPSRLIMVLGAASVALAVVYVKLRSPEQMSALLPVIAIYVLSLQRMMPSINNIGNYWMGLKGLAPRLETTYRTLTDESYAEPAGGEPFPGLREGLRVENLGFSYPARADVLKGVDIAIPRGKTLAVVGESGSGKSTLADLLLRVHEPGSGRILVDGKDCRSYSRASWLARIGMVTQDTFIFHASVKDNIRMGKLDASEEAVRRAAETAHADGFIREMPEGYDTVVGDRGVKLSGGQRQRIAIARAVLRDPELLILDEATSSLDNISEKIVQEALKAAGERRTTVVIAHRLSTVEHADKIVVLAGGKVLEEGSHAELLARRGAYHDLYQRQKEEKA